MPLGVNNWNRNEIADHILTHALRSDRPWAYPVRNVSYLPIVTVSELGKPPGLDGETYAGLQSQMTNFDQKFLPIDPISSEDSTLAF